MQAIKRFLASRFIRYAYGKNDRKRDAGQTTPADITRFDNILYGSDQKLRKWQLLDVYRPAKEVESDGSLKKLPVIISVHGGSFVYGDKDDYQFYCMRLAQYGFAVVNYSYRLAPEARFPSSLEDTERVFQFVEDNAEKYGFDCNNVFAAGDSAGGHLLTMYVTALTNKDFGKNFTFLREKKLTLRGLALNNGKYNLNDDDPRVKLLLSGLMPEGGTEEELKIMDAASHVTKDFPPSFVMTCQGDFLKHDSDMIKTVLDKAGVRNEYHCYGNDEQPLWHVFHLYPKLEEAKQCNDDECRFFHSLIQ